MKIFLIKKDMGNYFWDIAIVLKWSQNFSNLGSLWESLIFRKSARYSQTVEFLGDDYHVSIKFVYFALFYVEIIFIPQFLHQFLKQSIFRKKC